MSPLIVPSFNINLMGCRPLAFEPVTIRTYPFGDDGLVANPPNYENHQQAFPPILKEAIEFFSQSPSHGDLNSGICKWLSNYQVDGVRLWQGELNFIPRLVGFYVYELLDQRIPVVKEISGVNAYLWELVTSHWEGSLLTGPQLHQLTSFVRASVLKMLQTSIEEYKA